MKSQIHSIQLSKEVYDNLVNYLSLHSAFDSQAKKYLKQLSQATEIKKCSKCVEPATESGSYGDFYCYRHWMSACTEGEPSLKQEQQLMRQKRKANRYLS